MWVFNSGLLLSARAAVEQVGLRGDLSGGPGDSQADFFRRDEAAASGADRIQTGKPGRPAGAVNQTTRDFIDFFQRTKGDPRLALGTVMASSIDQVHTALGGKRADAAEFWLRATTALLPYICGKPAVEIAVKSEKISLNLFAGLPGAPAQLPAGGIVAMLEQAAAQARAEGFDTPIGLVIEGEASETESEGKSGG